MGKTIADRTRKYYETMTDHEPRKARKRADAQRRAREAGQVRRDAKRVAFALSMVG